MNYSKEAIVKLTEFVKGDKEAGKWLVKNNFKELELLYYALKGYDGALRELKDKKYYEAAAFATAVRGNAKAFNWLVLNKKYEWAAMARVINKKQDAALWLQKHNLRHYLELAAAISAELIIENEGDAMGMLFRWLRQYKGIYGMFRKK